MFKLIKREIRTLDSKMAKDFLALNTLEVQRQIRERHVSYLKKTIEDGLFLTAEIAVAKLNYNGGEKKLVNGQHTCTALIQTDKTIKALVEEFTVDDPEDLSLLYRQFDAHAARSLANILRPEADALGIDWPPRIVSLVVTSAALKEGKRDAIKSVKVDFLRKYRSFGAFLSNLLVGEGIETENGRLLMRGPVGQAILSTWEKSQDDCRKFWVSVRDGEGLKREDPAYKLRNYLLRTTVSFGRGATTGKDHATYHEMASKCISAWNAFRKGEKTDLKYYRDKLIPKAI